MLVTLDIYYNTYLKQIVILLEIYYINKHIKIIKLLYYKIIYIHKKKIN